MSAMFDMAARQQLLRLARQRIAAEFDGSGKPTVPTELPAELKQRLACFVTLKMHGQLRGCIGNLEPHSSLVEMVIDNAHAAAFRDPRFEPLSEAELAEVRISISVLNTPKPLSFADETHLLSQLRPGIDGLIIMKANRQATFLPTVWESLPEPEEFLQQLKLKAGIGINVCPDQAQVYQSESFSEPA